MAVYVVLKGVVDEVSQSKLWDCGCQGIEEMNPTEGQGIRAYFDTPVALPEGLEGEWHELEQIDWMAKYYAELQPIYLESLIVSPSHHTVEAKQNEHVIYLDPGMAFGTGHHETTQLALETLEKSTLKNQKVLDVGTGSGILAIAASLLGAATVDAVDNDPQTIPVALQNIQKNAPHHAITVRCDTLNADIADATYDIVIANLFAELHVQLMKEYARVLKPDGTLIITGILDERCGLVEQALTEHFILTSKEKRNEWFLLTARKHNHG